MGFFNRFEKVGAGIDPDAPEKRSFFKFFELFFRKFSGNIKVNLLYSLTMIPTFLPVFVIIFALGPGFFVDAISSKADAAMLIVAFFAANLFVSVFGMGPVTAGITYVMRNFAAEEHAWIWSDFKDNVKSNFKQSLVVYIINIVMLTVFVVAILFYMHMDGPVGYLRYFVYIMVVIFAMMNLYIYPLMVTFKLSIKELYRNSLLFAIGKLPSNLLLLAGVAFVHIGLPMLSVMYGGRCFMIFLMILIILEVLMLQSFTAFMVNFGVYSKIKEYIPEAVKESETLFEDDVRIRKGRK